jgi:hypothetical protein
MADLWDKVKHAVGEIYTTASGRAVEGVNLGVKKLDEVSIRRELSKEFTGLGGRAYQLLKRDQSEALTSDPTIRHHMSRLEVLEQRLEEKEREIQEALRPEGRAEESRTETEGDDAFPAPPAEDGPDEPGPNRN